jgi:hypothetical protein
MNAFAGFVIRLVAYALVLGVVARIAAAMWTQFGLDGVLELQPVHDAGIDVLIGAPLPLALLGFGALRRVAIFAAALLAGAALTAPFACARFAGL